jgi:hypothetical protein
LQALADTLAARRDAVMRECDARTAAMVRPTGPPPTNPPGQEPTMTRVGGGPHCSDGLVETALLDAPVVPDLIPITDEAGTRVGYWSAGVGWLTPEDVTAAGFSIADYRQAVSLLMNEKPEPQG